MTIIERMDCDNAALRDELDSARERVDFLTGQLADAYQESIDELIEAQRQVNEILTYRVKELKTKLERIQGQ